ncbi:MAG: hypothetical protein DMG34_19895, partial [Acidobacteria bacterium]
MNGRLNLTNPTKPGSLFRRICWISKLLIPAAVKWFAYGSIELRVTQVDVGLPGAVRRLFQGIAPQKFIRKVQGQFPPRSIRWEFVNLVESDPLRRVKLRITHEKLEDLHPADLADIVEDLSAAERQGIIASL